MVRLFHKKKTSSSLTTNTNTTEQPPPQPQPQPPQQQPQQKEEQQTTTVSSNEQDALSYKFFKAIQKGNLDVVKECINNGVDKKENDGWTALHCACWYGHLEIVHYLIEICHVDKESKTHEGMTALHIAMEHGHMEIVKYLIETCHVNKEAKDDNGWTALHYACEHDKLEIVQYLVETCHVNAKANDNDGRTALYYATKNDRLEIAQYLIETSEGQTVIADKFFQAVIDENLDAITECINIGIDKEVKESNGMTALLLASTKGRLNSVQYLLEACHVDKDARNRDGRNALYCASEHGHLDIVQYFIETCHVDMEAKDSDGWCGWTMLHYASRYNHLHMVQYLIEKVHVDKDAKDDSGKTALHYASKYGRLQIIQYLIVTRHVDREAKDNRGMTALHCASQWALSEIVQCLIETYHVDKEAKDNDGQTALHYASENGRLGIVQCLIETCHVDKEAKSNYGWTALHCASRRGRLDIVQYLIEACRVDKEAKDNDGKTALHYASKNGHLEIAEYLVETCHVDKEAKDNDGKTALHYATMNDHVNIVEFLLETCHVDKEAKDDDGWSTAALHGASRGRRLDIVQNLIETCHVDMGAKEPKHTTTAYQTMSSEEQTALTDKFFQAAIDGELAVIMECINVGIDKEAKGVYGYTALHYASNKGSLNSVQYLIETCHVNKEAKDDDGKTALHRASKNGRLNVVKYLVEKSHVDKEAKDNRGMTALHCASQWAPLEIVQCLIEICHVDKEAKDNDGQTALHYASENGRLRIVQFLIETCHVDEEAKSNYGWTALHCASRRGRLDIVQYLIEACRVDKEAKDNDGKTALHNANMHGHLQIVHYLIETCRLNLASKNGHLEIVEYLTNAETAFLKVARDGNLDIVIQCINNGVDKETKDEGGSTALHIASFNGHLDIVRYLIEKCHVDNKANDNKGMTALHYASWGGSLATVQYLIETCQLDIGAKDIKGRTADDVADNTNVAQYIIESKERQRQLFLEFIDAVKVGSLEKVMQCVNHGTNAEAKNNYGINALHKACSHGHLEIVCYLVQDCHINVEAKTNIGRTALHDACSNGYLDIVKYLIQTCHVNAETKDNNGWTALHFASRYGYLEIIQFLIQQCDVDVEVNNNSDETAYDLARKADIIEYFDRVKNDTQAPKNELNEQPRSISAEKEIQNDTTLEAAPQLTRDDIELLSQIGIKGKGRAPLQLDWEQSPLTDSEKINDISDHQKPALSQYKLNEKWISDLAMSLKSENQQLVDMLNQMGSSLQFIDERRDIIDLIIVEKCNTIEEQEEQSAILASPLHRDFYLLLQRKLKCMIKSCEGLSTGMVGVGSGDLRAFTARTIREKGCNVLQETNLGFFIGSAVQWAKKNLAVVPFIDTVGSVFQLVVTLKDERDRYVGLAHVADFATMVCLPQFGSTSMDSAVEKFARLIVRARCRLPYCKFVEEKDELGTFKQLMVSLLADSGNTPAKEQASKAADCAFAHIMKPNKDSVLFDVMHGGGFDVGLDEALAATILGVTLEDLNILDPFTATAVIQSSSDRPIQSTRENATTTDESNVLLNGSRLSKASILQGVNFASSDLYEEQEAKIQKQDEMIQQLSHQVTQLVKANKQSNSRVNYDAGDGLMYANPTEQFKNEITGIQTDNATLDRRLCDQATILDELRSQVRDLQKELQIQRGYR